MTEPKTYRFKWRRRLFWHSVEAITHRYDSHQDKLCIFRHPGGGLMEIKNWSQCEARLGTDWVDVLQATRAQMPTAVPAQPRHGAPMPVAAVQPPTT